MELYFNRSENRIYTEDMLRLARTQSIFYSTTFSESILRVVIIGGQLFTADPRGQAYNSLNSLGQVIFDNGLPVATIPPRGEEHLTYPLPGHGLNRDTPLSAIQQISVYRARRRNAVGSSSDEQTTESESDESENNEDHMITDAEASKIPSLQGPEFPPLRNTVSSSEDKSTTTGQDSSKSDLNAQEEEKAEDLSMRGTSSQSAEEISYAAAAAEMEVEGACGPAPAESESDDEEEEEDECKICLVGLKDGDLIRTLKCSHYFHPICVTVWLQNKTTCPYCRSPEIH